MIWRNSSKFCVTSCVHSPPSCCISFDCRNFSNIFFSDMRTCSNSNLFTCISWTENKRSILINNYNKMWVGIFFSFYCIKKLSPLKSCIIHGYIMYYIWRRCRTVPCTDSCIPIKGNLIIGSSICYSCQPLQFVFMPAAFGTKTGIIKAAWIRANRGIKWNRNPAC